MTTCAMTWTRSDCALTAQIPLLATPQTPFTVTFEADTGIHAPVGLQLPYTAPDRLSAYAVLFISLQRKAPAL